MTFLNFNKSPVAYGAIMYNGSAGPGIASCYPFFTSQTILSSFINDVDDYWTVMPGYKLIVYADAAYGGATLLTGDNTNGVAPVSYTMNPNYNLASSLQLFFKGTRIDQPS
jgi:hypothetical protein